MQSIQVTPVGRTYESATAVEAALVAGAQFAAAGDRLTLKDITAAGHRRVCVRYRPDRLVVFALPLLSDDSDDEGEDTL